MRTRDSGVVDAALVFVGGAVGTALRALILLPDSVPWIHVGVPLVNIVGAFVLGVVTGALAGRAESVRAHRMRVLLGTGLLGGFTTYSALAVAGTDGWWILVAVGTVVVGTLAALVGLRIGRGRAA